MYGASHGDTRHILLIPHDMNSCFDFARRSFDVADRFQTPVFVAMDLDLGMNLWSSEPLKLEKEPYDLGKRLSAEQLEEWAKAGKKFRRYFDQDGDASRRTMPGTSTDGVILHRGSIRHDAKYSNEKLQYILDRLRKKFETARKFVPKPIIERERGVKTGIVCYGSSYEPVREARDRLKARGLKTNQMLIRALPLTGEVRDFLAEHDTIYLVEQNRDAQMAAIIKDEQPEVGAKIMSVLVYNGLPVTAGEVVKQIFDAAQSAQPKTATA
jgi:2-oxoglutarate ferredoxin oxidoreductase subunit alpha